MKVLFLSASTGGGHYKAAEALYEQIELKHPGSGSVIIDAMKAVSPHVDRLIVNTYLGTIKNAPYLYSTLYRLAESGQGLCNAARNLNGLLSGRLLDLVNMQQPSVIVCTHTLPLQMLSCLKSKGRLNVPVVAVVTDFANHMFWKLEGVDAYVVAHDRIKSEMSQMGIPEEKIFAFGIPISRHFVNKTDRPRILSEIGLRQKPTLLVMGGSLGLGCVERIFEELLKIGRDIQVIAVAGRNAGLKARLDELSKDFTGRAKVFGYTDRIPDLMGISDYFVTKPGGMAISEALAKSVPILLLPPLPGQEEKNAGFLTGMGAAIRLVPAGNPGYFKEVFNDILDHPEIARETASKAQTLARMDSTDKTISLLEEMGRYGILNSETASSL